MKNDKWISELESGIIELDRENRTLMTLIDGVIAAVEAADTANLRRALTKLQDQAKIDFAREDGLMDAIRYQGAAQHQSGHQQLLAEIQHHIDDINAGQIHAPSLLRFQQNWLIPHVLNEDILFGQAILNHKGIHDRRHAHGPRMTEDELDAFEDRRLGILECIVWSGKLDVGVAVIDAEHRALVVLYNSIIDASTSRDRIRLAELLEQLGNDTAAHFETEDQLMAQFGYEDAAAHRKEHQDLLHEYGHQVEDWRANHISSEFLCRFMYRWLLSHVITADKPLGKAIQSRQIS